MKIGTIPVNIFYESSKNITRLSISNFNINQETMNSLSTYLQTEGCNINELLFYGINLSNINYLCCLTSNNKINKLWLRFCRLKDKGIDDLLTVLDETNKKSQLNLLNLDQNGITCEGAIKLAQVLRTNRTLQSLSLANNSIKDEGALALLNILSKFNLNDQEIKWKSFHEKRRNRLVEFLMDVITLKSQETQLTSSFDTINNDVISTEEESLKQRADKMIYLHPHPYLTDQLLESCSNLYCPGNFKISHLNISYNQFSLNILDIIEQILQYQQKVCLAEEGIRVLKIEGFDTKQKENIYKLAEKKRY